MLAWLLKQELFPVGTLVVMAVSEMAATATAKATFPRHHALRCRTSLATHLATAVAVAVGANSGTD